MNSNHTDLGSDLFETRQDIVEVLSREASRHLGSNSGFVPRHHREHDGSSHHALFTERLSHGFCSGGFSAHNGDDGGFRIAGVEAHRLEFFAEVVRVLPQTRMVFGFIHQHFNRGFLCSRHTRWLGSGEEPGP